MKTLIKVLTLPIWLPFAILWFLAKILAFAILVIVALFLVVHFI